MQLFILILSIINTISFCRHRRKHSSSRFSYRDGEVDEYINFIDQFELDDNQAIWDDDKKEIILESNINDVKFKRRLSNNQKLPIFKPLNWVKIKEYLNTPNNRSLMKKFLVLRYEDLKFILKKAVTQEPFSKCESHQEIEFIGILKDFHIPCVKFHTDGPESEEIEGKIVFKPSGSGTFTSDIDVSVDFQFFEKDKYSKQLGFRIGGEIIKNYNQIFIEDHEVSSAEAFDVNLYSLNFGDMLDLIFQLKNYSDYHYLRFLYANRLSVLLLLYNDAYNKGINKQGKTFVDAININLEEIQDKIAKVYEESNSEKISYFCGKIMIPDESGLYEERSHDPIVRNDQMVDHLIIAAKKTVGQYLYSLCHILASNYYALEAYVPIGSIIDIKLLQESISPIDLTPYPGLYDVNYKVDALLMNFSYGVEHYYEFYGEPDAIKKFSKYMARVLRLVKNLEDEEQKNCWIGAFNELLGNKLYNYWSGDDDLLELKKPDVDSLIKDINKNISNEKANLKNNLKNNRNTNNKRDKVLEFFSDGFQCVARYAFSIHYNVINLSNYNKISPLFEPDD